MIVIAVILEIAGRFSWGIIKENMFALKARQNAEKQIIDGDLKHQVRNIKNPLMDLSEEEVEQIIEAFHLTIPDSEDNIKFRLFAKAENSVSKMYYLELDNVEDREALYNANLGIPDRKVFMGYYNLKTDKSGSYPYYFVFKVNYESDYGPADEDIIKSVSEVYEQMKKQRESA